MRFKIVWLVSLFVIMGCTSLGEKGAENFPELVTTDETTQTTIRWISPTNLQIFNTLTIPVEISVSAISNVDFLIVLWCSGNKTVTNFKGYDIGKKTEFSHKTNILLLDEGTYYMWTKIILEGNISVTSQPIIIQAYTNLNRASAPVFSPLPGQSANPITLTLSSTTSGAVIFWTTNNWQKVASGTTPVTLSLGFGSYEVKAYATKEGYLQSDTVVGSYTISVAAPQAFPPAGSYDTSQTITFSSATTGATIFWTIDNWTNLSSSSLNLSSGVYTVQAYATKDGHFSSTNQWEYIISSSGVASPVFSPSGGTYDTETLVSATTATEGANIYLSTNGSEWLATNRILLPQGSWNLSAYAEKDGAFSLTNTKSYTITVTRVATPAFTPNGGSYPTNITVNITCATSGASLFWSTNGGNSWYSSTSVLFGPGMYLLMAYATKAGLTTSLTNTATYTIEDTTPPVAGGTIQISNIQASSAFVYWPAATDNATAQTFLQYLLVYANDSTLIDTLDEVTNPSAGVSQIGWTENMTSTTLSSLTQNTLYFVNVAVRDTSGNTALYTTTPVSFTTSSSSTPDGLLTIIFSNWNENRTLYIPGDHNSWDPNSITLSHTAGETSMLSLSNTVTTTVIGQGSSSTEIEFKIINNPNWVDQWSFTSWTRVGPIALYDSGKQIAIACDNNDVVTVLFDVGNSTVKATVEARP
ncbi:chitobiase/beta-hexosaminidase C-terminal domain-containing protein [Thermospira aquatica]|uniref:Chitobiase/beta-hexosaminidase C-terminal domain-containing protein n=1 Tax=Thermospira aquatica TaxID=2828656 RepID=A0AAX3BCM4_9SPIR|nr:chitobiase/beta-hexosaminidase C-terminal domain-containing protein [Thermospira aquatica]URA09955.1 chitobiase/beta-hexosaminidase C-terminal domain-containing protein [Thermospira aquatica]